VTRAGRRWARVFAGYLQLPPEQRHAFEAALRASAAGLEAHGAFPAELRDDLQDALEQSGLDLFAGGGWAKVHLAIAEGTAAANAPEIYERLATLLPPPAG